MLPPPFRPLRTLLVTSTTYSRVVGDEHDRAETDDEGQDVEVTDEAGRRTATDLRASLALGR